MGLLDSVGGFAREAKDSIAHAAEKTAHAAGDAFSTAVEEAKAGANAVATVVRDVDATKQQVGAWIDAKEQQLEQKVDEGRAWLRDKGGVAGQVASAQIGLVEGVATSVYGAGKGIVQLADGASSLANPLEWAANPDANIARLKSAGQTVETLGKIAGMVQPTSWLTDPKGNAQLAGALWDSAATSFTKDPAKFVGNAVGTVGMFFIPGGQGGAGAAAVADTGRAATVLNDVGKVAEIAKLADAGKAAETVNAAGKLVGVAEDAGALTRVAARGIDDVAGGAIARGEPFAFGVGDRSVRATAIIDRSAQALGRNAASLVDNVVYDAAAQSPYFTVDRATGLRSITLDAATFGKTEAGQLVAGTHELVHAEQWEAVLSSHAGNLTTAHSAMFRTSRLDYAIREVVTERRALQAVDSLLGGITPQQVGHSSRYIEFWQQRVMALGGSRVP
ncbi:hypothetical protein [Bradyrhizobium roseum]|uniref:hypothetical protein n=1 Tax=Bradyrhizobium roseum TaxID=3056648 RepID=UPI002639E3B7|nr:hypothetical protein [Bradyrhizobium roseus]WKA25813.1 hypothetical protein QUH67_19490 [Bradyrhizobium roseus]